MTPKSTCEIFESSTISVLIASSISFASQKQQTQQKLKSSSNRCQWCQLNYDFWNSHRFQYFSCAAQNQQAYEFALQFLEKQINENIEKSAVFVSSVLIISSAQQKQQKQQKSNALKIAKKIKINAVKNAKRVKSKTIKAEKVAKLTSEFQNIDIFDSTLTCENRRFSEIAKFLQHLQQCQYLYRESNLFVLLLICLWNSVFDIWYDRQSIMNSASLCEWIDILRIDFAAVAFAKSKVNCSKIICMRCDSNFNFKKKFREHVREQHAKKSVNNSSFSIDTVNSTCDIEKKSFITLVESLIFVTSRNLTSDTKTFLQSVSSKCSSFQLRAFNSASKSMKSASNQEITCAQMICKFCKQNFNFNKKLYEHIRNHEVSKLVKDSHLSINAINWVCEAMKMSIIACSSASQKFNISIASSRQISESTLIFGAVISIKISHFSSRASETVSESMKNTST